MFGDGGCQGAARAGCSAMEGVPGAKCNSKAGESSHLTNKEPGCTAASQGQDWLGDSGQDQTQSSGHPAGPQRRGRSEAKPGCQVSEFRSGTDLRRCDTVQTELLHGCTVAQARASAKTRLKSGSQGKGEAGPRY